MSLISKFFVISHLKKVYLIISMVLLQVVIFVSQRIIVIDRQIACSVLISPVRRKVKSVSSVTRRFHALKDLIGTFHR
jgi:hypothetical protein